MEREPSLALPRHVCRSICTSQTDAVLYYYRSANRRMYLLRRLVHDDVRESYAAGYSMYTAGCLSGMLVAFRERYVQGLLDWRLMGVPNPSQEANVRSGGGSDGRAMLNGVRHIYSLVRCSSFSYVLGSTRPVRCLLLFGLTGGVMMLVHSM